MKASPSARVRLATELHAPLPPQKRVGKRRDVAHVDAAADHAAALCTAASACGTSAPTGAKMIAASSASGGAWSEPPAQSAPSAAAKSCAAVSPGG